MMGNQKQGNDMNKILQGTLFAAGLICAAGADAAAYKCTDDGGHTVYSDIPCVKKAPPPPKAEPAAVVKAADAAVLSKIAEADVLRALDLSQEYSHSNNAAEACNLFGADHKFRVDYQLPKIVKVVSGGHDEACRLAREAAEQSKRTGIIGLIERGPTKVKIEAGEMRASASYDVVYKTTRYDRIIDSYRCSSKDQFVLAGGKVVLVGSDSVCKP
jgi:hypothetical protein